MASRQSLRKIGEEAFKLKDQAEEKQRLLLYHPAKPYIHYLQPPQVTNAHRADHFYPGGQNGYRVQETPAADAVVDEEDHGGVMDCYEAARRFGGMVVTEYYPNRRITVKRNERASY